jgi:hypothetical protein
MTRYIVASHAIDHAADLIERRQYVSQAGIPALVTLLRGLAEAVKEHESNGPLANTQLCADEVDALRLARMELDA